VSKNYFFQESLLEMFSRLTLGFQRQKVKGSSGIFGKPPYRDLLDGQSVMKAEWRTGG
jgi:hypothetical protein